MKELQQKVRNNLDSTVFYHRMSDLLGYVSVPGPLTPYADYQEPRNIDGGDAYGGDIELAYKDEHQRLSVWYAYDHFQLDQENQGIRAFCPPKYRFGFNGRWFLDDGWVFNANYRFNDETPENPGRMKAARIDRYQVCDLAISKKIANGNGEIMFGVSDVFDKTNDPVFETTMGANHTTPGRMFFGRVQFHF